jgi:hypothetical protein
MSNLALTHANNYLATNVPSVDSPRNMEKVDRHIDAVPPLTEPDTLFFTLSTDSPFATTPSTSLNTLPLI